MTFSRLASMPITIGSMSPNRPMPRLSACLLMVLSLGSATTAAAPTGHSPALASGESLSAKCRLDPCLPECDLIRDELEAAQKDKGKNAPKQDKDKPAPSKKEKKPKDLSDLPATDSLGIIPDVSEFPPGKRPCLHIGTEGEALGLPGDRPGKVICKFKCGTKFVDVTTWGRGSEILELCRKRDPKW